MDDATEIDEGVLKNLWLDKVLPYFPPECEAKIRADVAAMKWPLPSQARFIYFPTTKYLRQHDLDWLRTFVDRPSFLRRSAKRNLTITGVLMVACALALFFSPLQFAVAVIVVLAIMAGIPLAILSFEPQIRRWIVRSMGPLGCPLMNNVTLKSLFLGLQGTAGLYVILMSDIAAQIDTGDASRLFVLQVLSSTATVFCFVAALAGYLFYRAKIGNSYDIAACVLELPGYKEE